ncbi:hypothetical protein [Amycolatopsis sp. PS_44_ISF1]|uniref:hypothetical protein n=1 Tax=Amycolatopsis sp. PS_44_ISF1 TaxID=2974917 RepID=UPI0028DE559E|nr:hypothetical protein [Amycolatopsis sp. PS_44_ISF1]MDT8911148.1 hypothetical protein [Amycolatopsis sp. PS_44_ISF1]
MAEPAEHRQYEGDYYAETQHKQEEGLKNFGNEDKTDVSKGIQGRTEQAAAQYSVAQGDQLLQDQATRGDAPAPSSNYAAHDHQALYDMVHTNLDARDIDAKGRVSNKVGNWLADLSNTTKEAATTSGAEWQGAGASQAHGFFQSTATYTAQTASAAQLSSNRYSQQAAAADHAQKSMPKPSGFDQQAEIEKATVQYATGDPAAGAQTMNALAVKQQQAQADHAQAVQVLQGLDNTYHGTATTQPAFAPPPPIDAPDSSTHISSAQPSGGVGPHGSGVGVSGGSSYNSAGGQPGSAVPGSGVPGSGVPGVGTGAGSSYAPPGAGASTGSGTVGGPIGSGGGLRGPGGGGGFGRVSPDALAMGGPAGGAGGGGGETTRSRPGIGTGRSGGGFAGSRVSGGGYKPGEVEEPGKGAGAGKGGAGERLERGATAAANAGKGGKAGEAAAAGTGAGKKKEEDKEHKNKIPTQVDPDEVFEVRPERGPDGEKITPPVIGG